MNEPMTVGEWIRTRRIGAGLTQEELGYRLGINQNQVSKLEKGRRRTLPTLDEARMYADALGTTPDDLARAMGFLPSQEDDTTSDTLVFTSMMSNVERLQLPPRLESIMKDTIEYVREQARAERGELKPGRRGPKSP